MAVSMAFLALVALGLLATSLLPVSLLPDLDIPHVSVHVRSPVDDARRLEDHVMRPLRQRLMRINGLEEITSVSGDGSGTVNLSFQYGTRMGLAYIEVNEQVDRAMNSLPAHIKRPVVVKSSASDIPVLYLDISLNDMGVRGVEAGSSADHFRFLQLSEFVDEVVRRRIEQIPQVAMADMSGRAFPEILIYPQRDRLRAMDLSTEVVAALIRDHSMGFGNLLLHDKQLLLPVRTGGQLISEADIAQLQLVHQGRLWRLDELSRMETNARTEDGLVMAANRRAITLAVVKQADARMQDLKKALDEMVERLRHDYPSLDIVVDRDQGALLDHSMRNLRQSLLWGSGLAFVVIIAFMRDPRAPCLVIASLPAGLLASMLFFYLARLSINVISLSGLILCIGMMIDNAIILTDNITRHRLSGPDLKQACIKGSTEVFRPLVSSALTTCSVFFPLAIMGGLPGALFLDQAKAVSIGLAMSLAVAMCLVPVYYYVLYKRLSPPENGSVRGTKAPVCAGLYNTGFRLVLRKQKLVWPVLILLLMAFFLMVRMIHKERLPPRQQDAALIHIDWNEPIPVEENTRRILALCADLDQYTAYYSAQIGRQQFLLRHEENSREQSLIHLRATSAGTLGPLLDKVEKHLEDHYPNASFKAREEGNMFDRLFASRQPYLEARFRPLGEHGSDLPGYLEGVRQGLKDGLPGLSFDHWPLQQSVVLLADPRRMALYHVDAGRLQQDLVRLLGEEQVALLQQGRRGVPVMLGRERESVGDILLNGHVRNRAGTDIPLGAILTMETDHRLRRIAADVNGEFYPLAMDVNTSDVQPLMGRVSEIVRGEGHFEVSFTGNHFGNKDLQKHLVKSGLLALLLLYFILAAQFESLKLPLIVLVEVPLALAGSLLMLLLFGASLNIMSMTGMVVTTGIIINDSILKIDTINRLRSDGMPLVRALHRAGHYRLRPILMTSLTTICALVPFLLVGGLGGDLQKPLAITVMGGLALGTLVSLFVIPLCYYVLCKKRQ